MNTIHFHHPARLSALGRLKVHINVSFYKGAKGSVRFPLNKLLPFDLISRIVKFRVKENLDRAAAKVKKKWGELDKLKTLYVASRKDWRFWLEMNFDKEKEIWLVFPNKSSDKPRISYNDAVEEALCFGWIDSTVRSVNSQSRVQRFSPRNPKSSYSQANKERLKWLLQENLLHSSVLDTANRIAAEKFIFPPDIINAIKSDKIAWENYQGFSPSYKRIRVAYIDAARNRPGEFQKRLANFIAKTRANKQIGFGGIEKYY